MNQHEYEQVQREILADIRARHEATMPQRIGDIAARLIKEGTKEWECPHCGVVYTSCFGRMTCGTPLCHAKELEKRGMKDEADELAKARQRIEAMLDRARVPMRFWSADLEDFGADAKEYRWTTKKSVRIHGQVGRGKTHLAVALLKSAYRLGTTERGTDKIIPARFEVRFVRAHDYLKAIKSTFRRASKESERDVLAEYTSPDVLVLDDIGAESASDYGWSELLTLIESRAYRLKTTIATTNLSITDMFKHEPRLASRMKEWRAVELTGLDRRQP